MPASGEVIEAIEAHLVSHPLAADSVEGVARWWLGSAGVVATLQEVEAALEALVLLRRLRRVRLADGNALYCGTAGDGSDGQAWAM